MSQSISFKIKRNSRKSKNLNIESRLSERRFTNLNFNQMNKQWSVIKEARNTISILNSMKGEKENQTEKNKKAL